jgi:F0F1-type ATP synthase assembly protein I
MQRYNIISISNNLLLLIFSPKIALSQLGGDFILWSGYWLAILIILFRKKQWISQNDYYEIEKVIKKRKKDKINKER